MKQLGKVLNKTSWAQASNTINTNSESVFSAVTMLENAAFKHKGYFLTGEEVEQLYPSAEEGSQAFVYNSSNPSTAPYDIYQMVGGTWTDTGLNGGSVSVDLTKKQDTLVGYSESVSGGKATQVAIQGDAIALSGKVSLGNVDDMEFAILMSSSQAGAAIAKANTLEQSMTAIKLPVKPIHLNSQGKLELNIGKGLYVEDGKLCATGASGGGGGGGATYSEGDGIRIYNDTISVAYDIDTLKVNSCGGLTVNYGEGLTLSNRALVVKHGTGLAVDSCGKLIVDAANLTVGNADKLGGNGIGNFMTFENFAGSYVGANFNNSTLSKLAGEKYIEFWDGAGGWFNSVWGKVTANSGFVGNLTGTADKAIADANGNDIATTYAPHFWPGQGMNLSNDSVLSLPNLTASVINGAVDGVKNNNQRVLNLSCGAIQIKLSTGLAIDEEGYLYVQDKYVTK
jgi:hypothetical protein